MENISSKEDQGKNLIIKCLNQIISENKPYNLCVCTFTFNKFQEKNLNLNRDSKFEIPVQVQIILLKFKKGKHLY